MSALSDLVRLLKQEKRTGSDYTGVVTRIEENMARVRMTGSDVMDTPVSMTIDCKAGDKVRVRVANGKAWLTGNDTAPPTSDKENIEKIRISMKDTGKEISQMNRRIREMSRPQEMSHIGMVIHSTTFDTMDKVIAFYGGEAWIQHSGYFLYGATSDVTANAASKDGGAASVTLSVDEMPSHTHVQESHNHTQNAHTHTQNSHNHTQNSHSHTMTNKYTAKQIASGTAIPRFRSDGDTSVTNYTSCGGTTATNNATTATNKDTTATNKATTAVNKNTGGGKAHNNMPPYKNVYIWERTA